MDQKTRQKRARTVNKTFRLAAKFNVIFVCVMIYLENTTIIQNFDTFEKQAEAEVVPSSSLVKVEVEVKVGVEVDVGY